MLDKDKFYQILAGAEPVPGSRPSKRFSRVKILFEDDIGYYVESHSEMKDGAGNYRRYSVKKHCFTVVGDNDILDMQIKEKQAAITSLGQELYALTIKRYFRP